MNMNMSFNNGVRTSKSRQARYRMKLRSINRPESCHADSALANAAAAFIALMSESHITEHKLVVEALVKGALNLLVEDGYERDECVSVLMRRLSPTAREDMQHLIDISRLKQRLKIDN